MKSSINWGIVGASTIAKEWMINAINASPESQVTAILSRSQQRGREFGAQFGIARTYTDLSAFLADPDIDVVYVGTTNELHKPQTLAAASVQKHVLCEKPLALSLADARQMAEACTRAGVVMGTNHHLRNAVTHRKLRELVQDGAIGQPLAVRVFHAVMLPPHLQTWRIKDPGTGAGVVLDITVHDTDTLRFILDDEVESVAAFTSAQGLGEHGISDTVMGVMRFNNGTLAQFHDSFVIGHAGTGLEVHGTNGSLVATDVMTQQPVGNITLRRGDLLENIELPPHTNLYERAVGCFNNAVQGNGAPAATAEDGIRSLAVALAVEQAAQTGSHVRVAYA
ncbi:MAG: Gfo/Idh/MocA family oxidoreductase [Bacteroidota bacterium]|nr:Gfo/Idh/MocA family oxidoreductase [Bacteroidota bacterium]MDE2827773.1 Gfo/Idh/MocA family oxidoreductase [Bacteroidota bacterium]